MSQKCIKIALIKIFANYWAYQNRKQENCCCNESISLYKCKAKISMKQTKKEENSEWTMEVKGDRHNTVCSKSLSP